MLGPADDGLGDGRPRRRHRAARARRLRVAGRRRRPAWPVARVGPAGHRPTCSRPATSSSGSWAQVAGASAWRVVLVATGRRSIATRVAIAATGTLLVVVLAVSVALFSVIGSTVERQAVERLARPRGPRPTRSRRTGWPTRCVPRRSSRRRSSAGPQRGGPHAGARARAGRAARGPGRHRLSVRRGPLLFLNADNTVVASTGIDPADGVVLSGRTVVRAAADQPDGLGGVLIVGHAALGGGRLPGAGARSNGRAGVRRSRGRRCCPRRRLPQQLASHTTPTSGWGSSAETACWPASTAPIRRSTRWSVWAAPPSRTAGAGVGSRRRVVPGGRARVQRRHAGDRGGDGDADNCGRRDAAITVAHVVSRGHGFGTARAGRCLRGRSANRWRTGSPHRSRGGHSTRRPVGPVRRRHRRRGRPAEWNLQRHGGLDRSRWRATFGGRSARKRRSATGSRPWWRA